MKIDLLYFKDCPSYKKAKDIIEEVLKGKGIETEINLVEVTGEMDAKKLKFQGSPTVLVDGKDVDGGIISKYGFGCRIYNTKNKIQPYPSKGMIEKAVDSALKGGE